MKRSGSFVERCGRYTMHPGSFFMTAATCSFSSAASASPLPFFARSFATTVRTSAIGLFSFRGPPLRVVIRAPEPAHCLRHVFRRVDVHLDPAAAREAPVRAQPRLAQRARLVDGTETNPEVTLFLAQ